ncbi:unnamed protein product [Closterium sp. NIES-65]|nr:unnamed protein product [Closterium sp. NIES-65]
MFPEKRDLSYFLPFGPAASLSTLPSDAGFGGSREAGVTTGVAAGGVAGASTSYGFSGAGQAGFNTDAANTAASRLCATGVIDSSNQPAKDNNNQTNNNNNNNGASVSSTLREYAWPGTMAHALAAIARGPAASQVTSGKTLADAIIDIRRQLSLSDDSSGGGISGVFLLHAARNGLARPPSPEPRLSAGSERGTGRPSRSAVRQQQGERELAEGNTDDAAAAEAAAAGACAYNAGAHSGAVVSRWGGGGEGGEWGDGGMGGWGHGGGLDESGLDGACSVPWRCALNGKIIASAFASVPLLAHLAPYDVLPTLSSLSSLVPSTRPMRILSSVAHIQGHIRKALPLTPISLLPFPLPFVLNHPRGIYEGWPQEQEKLRCLLHYFRRVVASMPQGTVSYERKVLPLTAVTPATVTPAAAAAPSAIHTFNAPVIDTPGHMKQPQQQDVYGWGGEAGEGGGRGSGNMRQGTGSSPPGSGGSGGQGGRRGNGSGGSKGSGNGGGNGNGNGYGSGYQSGS